MKGKKLNIGVQILRIIFSFHILIFHCLNRKMKKKYFFLRNVDVDLIDFFIISFYYSYNTFTSKNIIKIKQRFYRLLIPYIIWPLLFLFIHNFTCYVNGKKKFYIKSKYLYYQLLCGNGIHFVFWFQFNLIILSILFLIIIFISKKKHLFFFIIIGFSLYKFFSSQYVKKYLYNNTILLFSIRPIPSSYLYSLVGFILFRLNNVVKFEKYLIKFSFICIIALYIYIYDRNLFGLEAYYFMIKILAGITVFIIFLNLPFHKIDNNLIKLLTSYSGGIYYLHTKMRILLEYLFNSMKSRTMTACIINYYFCFSLSHIGSKIFKKVNLRYLFE